MANDSTPMNTDRKVGRELAAVAPRAIETGIKPLVPTSMEELKFYANLIIGGGLAPDSYDNNATKIALGIAKSLEVGLPPLTGLANIAIVNNRACIWGDGAYALVQSRGVVERMEIVEVGAIPGENDEVSKFPDDYGFEVRIWRKGQTSPYIGRFTVGDAKRAKLWMHPKKQPWMLYPKRMLKNRAAAFPLRDGFADCLAGLAIREEVEDLPPVAEPKADTSFLDDEIPAKTIDAEPISEPDPPLANPEPALLPVPDGKNGPDWGAWQAEAEKIIGQATTNTFLDAWTEANKAALANFSIFSPTAHGALMKMVKGIKDENARSAA
jgi:hypothetical protein